MVSIVSVPIFAVYLNVQHGALRTNRLDERPWSEISESRAVYGQRGIETIPFIVSIDAASDSLHVKRNTKIVGLYVPSGGRVVDSMVLRVRPCKNVVSK